MSPTRGDDRQARIVIAGVVLAGGASSRMGFDKAFAVLDGRPLIEHVLDRFRAQVGVTMIAANGDPSRFAAYSAPVLPDDDPDRRLGPLAGIAAGLRFAARHGASTLAIVPTDAPFLPRDLVQRLDAERRPQDISVASTANGLEPLFSLWPVESIEAVEAALANGRLGVARLIVNLPHRRVAFATTDHDPFRNVNRPTDLVAADLFLHAPSKTPTT